MWDWSKRYVACLAYSWPGSDSIDPIWSPAHHHQISELIVGVAPDDQNQQQAKINCCLQTIDIFDTNYFHTSITIFSLIF